EVDLLLGHREGGVDDHVEQAELGGQEFARAAAPALQEQLDGESVTDEASDVGVDDGGVEAVTLEAPADEEGASSSEDRPHRHEVQVVPGGDERQGQVPHVEEVAEDQVVDRKSVV